MKAQEICVVPEPAAEWALQLSNFGSEIEKGGGEAEFGMVRSRSLLMLGDVEFRFAFPDYLLVN